MDTTLSNEEFFRQKMHDMAYIAAKFLIHAIGKEKLEELYEFQKKVARGTLQAHLSDYLRTFYGWNIRGEYNLDKKFYSEYLADSFNVSHLLEAISKVESEMEDASQGSNQ